MKKKYTLEYHVGGNDLEANKNKADYVFGFSYNKLLYKGKTKFQTIELYQTPLWGKLLKLDGFFQTSERDEFFYHEVVTHTTLCSHPNPRKVLIIGGGDGGILKNVLKHKCVKEVTLVEIDGEVIDFSKKYLSFVCGEAFKDNRVKVIVGDGLKFVGETEEKFDVVILDLTDPVGPAKALYTRVFYSAIKKLVGKGGVLALHMELFLTRPRVSQKIYRNLRSVYKCVAPFISFVPLYGGMQAFAVCSEEIQADRIGCQQIEKRLKFRKVKDLKLYNGKVHEAMFALPNYLKKLFSIN